MALYPLSTTPEDPTGVRALLGPAPLVWASVGATAGYLRHGEDWRLPTPPAGTGSWGFWITAVGASVALIGVLNLVSRLLATAVARFWLAPGGGPFTRALVGWRVWRWEAADAAAASATTSAALAHHSVRRNRIALAKPRCATWIGDRHASVEDRVRGQYALDIASAWPRLWLLLSPPEQHSLQAATLAWRNASRLAAWGLLYTALGTVWFPVAFLGLLIFMHALVDARSATGHFTDLAEAAVDIHLADLASALRVDLPTGTPQTHVGAEITAVTRKGG